MSKVSKYHNIIIGYGIFLWPGKGLSVKDRAAKWLVLDGEKRGILKRDTGQTVVEGMYAYTR